LSIIRWQATVFPFFAFYKDLSMLSCFAGLGLGYAMARHKRVANRKEQGVAEDC
jgi:hypothetical protein